MRDQDSDSRSAGPGGGSGAGSGAGSKGGSSAEPDAETGAGAARPTSSRSTKPSALSASSQLSPPSSASPASSPPAATVGLSSRRNVVGGVDGRDWVAEQLAAARAAARAAADPAPAPPSATVADAFRDLAADWTEALAAAWNGPHGRDVRLAVRAGAHAALAAVVGWLAAVTCCVSVWLGSAPDTAGVEGPLRVAGQLWLLGHHVALDVPAGRVAMAPLGFTALLVSALWHTAVAPVARPVQVAYTAFGAATAYGLVAALVAASAATGDVRPDAAQAVLFAVLFALAVPTAARWRRIAGFWGPPPWVATAFRAAGTAGAVLIAGGAATLAGTFIAHFPESGWPRGVGDAVGMFLLCLAVLPNAVLWSASFTLGPGFAVGTGTAVNILSVKTGALPRFPLLSAVPRGGGGLYPYDVAFLAIAVLAGVAAAWVVTRARHRRLGDRVRALSAASAGVASAAGLAATLSGGPLAGGRMATFGPSGWATAAATLVLVGVGAAAVVLLPASALAVRRLPVRGLLRAVAVLVPRRRPAEVRAGLPAPDEDDRQQPGEQGQAAEHLVDGGDPAVAEAADAAEDAQPEEDRGDDAGVVVPGAAGQGHPQPQAGADQAADDDRDHEQRLVAVDGGLGEAVVPEPVGDLVDLGQPDDDVD